MVFLVFSIICAWEIYIYLKVKYESSNVENRKILGPHALCVLMHWGIPLFHHDGQGYDHYVLQNVAGRGKIIIFYIMLPTGVRSFCFT